MKNKKIFSSHHNFETLDRLSSKFKAIANIKFAIESSGSADHFLSDHSLIDHLFMTTHTLTDNILIHWLFTH